MHRDELYVLPEYRDHLMSVKARASVASGCRLLESGNCSWSLQHSAPRVYSTVGSVYQNYGAASTMLSKKSSHLAYQIQIK